MCNIKFYKIVLLSVISLKTFHCVKGSEILRFHTAKKSKCLNPPRTARRVETYIGECQEEVKSKLANEAYQILKEEVSKNQPSFDQFDNTFDYFEEDPNANNIKQQIVDSIVTYAAEQQHANTEDNTKSVEEEQEEEEEDEQELEQEQEQEQQQENPLYHLRFGRLMHRVRRVDDFKSIYHPTLVPFEDKRIAGCLLHCVYAKNNAIDKNGWPTLDGLVDFYSEGVNEHGFFMATLRSVNLCLRAVSSKYRVDKRKLPEGGESCDLAFDVFDCISDQITDYCMDQYRY